MERAERMKVKATILESGVAHTFKEFGEWTSEVQAEISIEVLQEAVRLRKEGNRIMERVEKLRPLSWRPHQRRRPRGDN